MRRTAATPANHRTFLTILYSIAEGETNSMHGGFYKYESYKQFQRIRGD
jgi:hypothetical protein